MLTSSSVPSRIKAFVSSAAWMASEINRAPKQQATRNKQQNDAKPRERDIYTSREFISNRLPLLLDHLFTNNTEKSQHRQ